MKKRNKTENDDIRPEYDLDYSKARRGNYLVRLLKDGSNVVVLKPEVAAVFEDSDSVNEALQSLIDLSRKAEGAAKKARKAHPKAASVEKE